MSVHPHTYVYIITKVKNAVKHPQSNQSLPRAKKAGITGSVGEIAGSTLCKVFPSPGIARSVWALPQTASCNMVADTDHPAASANHEKDGSEADINEYSLRNIFDLVKTG